MSDTKKLIYSFHVLIKADSIFSDCYERQTELSKRDCRCTCDGCCQHSRARSRLAQKLREEKKDQRQMGR